MVETTRRMTVNVQPQGKNIVIAYLLWWFLGWAGLHRFYLGKTKTGLMMLGLSILGYATLIIGFGFIFLLYWGIWWVLDAYYVQKYVLEINTARGLPTSFVMLNTSHRGSDNLEQLAKLYSLFEKGAITKEQYESKRAGLL
jgi:TM2 domain-containing membrane protein YozV